MRGDINIYVSIRSYKYIVSDCNLANDGRIYSNPYTIPYYGNTFAFSSIFLADCYSFMKVYIIAKNCIGIDRYSIWMPNI